MKNKQRRRRGFPRNVNLFAVAATIGALGAVISALAALITALKG